MRKVFDAPLERGASEPIPRDVREDDAYIESQLAYVGMMDKATPAKRIQHFSLG